ncbi:enoyl-CoA hydratase-related protein [Legionella spiritensis]|uniref:Enoyl CoA hydratase/isomerase (Crotonase) n=1 Tax=Legionella spiritensis TaxID=452 RepID=A0A0W0YWW6_LEGSP|nr:enoyl-CoA hydratase-related protein [Legionella spiritensis]KTD61413.1 enoyl CoA hydratase/isomerase (crotonase) [Legionella spiritensis]SNV33428.1 enoyl CoA hydratase/isomerase (crotonase) [Legionella spiritensis]
MTDLLSEQQENIFIITLNRVAKHNAFDDQLLHDLKRTLDEAIQNPQIRAIILKANGKHFSAGADANWMQKMAQYSEEENLGDAMVLANVMYTLYRSTKPTIAMVHGAAFGGGAGLVAACDIAIAATSAKFCFSEVKLGLVPAVISPYVVRAIGERAARWLFTSAETFDAQRARELNLVHHCVSDEELWTYTQDYARQISRLAPVAVAECKTLVETVQGKPINEALIRETAAIIARKRTSAEGQRGLRAFLNKETPNWN